MPADPKMLEIMGCTTRTERAIRAPMKYPGGKFDCLDALLPHLPYRGAFVDVFGGSGTVIFNRMSSPLDVYNDRYGGICAFYRALRNDPKKLVDRLELICHSREEWEWCKATWADADLSDVERAARWYYMVQNSFVGLGRAWARITKPTSPVAGVIQKKLPHFWLIHQRLMRVQIENLDWVDVMNDYDRPDTVFYLDPPYMHADQSGYEHKFTDEDHKRMCDKIMCTKGFVALSGYPNELYDRYEWTNRIEFNRRDRANAQVANEHNGREDIGDRKMMTEVLWIRDTQV